MAAMARLCLCFCQCLMTPLRSRRHRRNHQHLKARHQHELGSPWSIRAIWKWSEPLVPGPQPEGMWCSSTDTTWSPYSLLASFPLVPGHKATNCKMPSFCCRHTLQRAHQPTVRHSEWRSKPTLPLSCQHRSPWCSERPIPNLKSSMSGIPTMAINITSTSLSWKFGVIGLRYLPAVPNLCQINFFHV